MSKVIISNLNNKNKKNCILLFTCEYKYVIFVESASFSALNKILMTKFLLSGSSCIALVLEKTQEKVTIVKYERFSKKKYRVKNIVSVPYFMYTVYGANVWNTFSLN